ncbi:MAG TPA: CBASS oligonucleotide cyclase [Nitrososphaera sp.]|nr:CBASS oligonucleotide cyclase [Nitrososphaera sp.]
MGGSGGGGGGGVFGDSNLDNLRKQATKKAAEAGLESAVNAYLKNQLASVNDRDVDTVRKRLEDIESALGRDIEGLQNILFGGSVSKHTYVDGISDVDSLVLIDAGSLENKSPREMIRKFAQSLGIKLSRAEVEEISPGTLAVTIRYRDGSEIQLLPAYRTPNGFAIADISGSKWKEIHPRKFAGALSKSNAKLGGMLVPTIKLAKALIANFPEQRRLSGYHVEALAEAAFRGYDGPKTPKAMVTHFFVTAAQSVKMPLVDRTGQSRHLDEDMGPADSLQRRMASDSLSRVARRMQAATSLEQWRALFEE